MHRRWGLTKLFRFANKFVNANAAEYGCWECIEISDEDKRGSLIVASKQKTTQTFHKIARMSSFKVLFFKQSEYLMRHGIFPMKFEASFKYFVNISLSKMLNKCKLMGIRNSSIIGLESIVAVDICFFI